MPIVRLPGGDLRDEIRQPIYDTMSIVGGGIPMSQAYPSIITNGGGGNGVGGSANAFDGQQFFSAVQGKAQWESNLQQNNMLATATSFRLQGLALDGQYIAQNSSGMGGSPILQALLPMIQDFGSLRVHIGEKDYWTGPLAYLMGRVEQNGSVSSLPNVGSTIVSGTTVAASQAVTVASTANLVIGQTVSGAGIPAGSYIQAISSATVFLLNANATAAATVPLLIGPAGPSGFLYQRAGAQAVQGVVFSGRHVVDINPLQSFYGQMSMDLPNAINTASATLGNQSLDVVNLKFSFKGLLRRPVQ